MPQRIPGVLAVSSERWRRSQRRGRHTAGGYHSVFGGAGFIGTHLREGVCSNGTSLPLATLRVTKSLHRIEESALRREVEAAGFKLVAEGDFLAPPRGCARLLDSTAEWQGGRRVRAQISEADVSSRRRVQRLSSLAPKNPRKAVAVDEHTRVQSEAPQAARLLLAF